ncbi:MAG: 50S ribosomal protein L6 [Pseudomonadota bacterium]
MSRIGKRPVPAPKGVEFKIEGQTVTVKGAKSAQTFTADNDVSVALEDGAIVVKPNAPTKRAKQQWGMTRTVIANMAQGLSEGFTKELELVGVGYRAQMQGKQLKMALGYSHDVIFDVPDGIDIACPKPTEIVIKGSDAQVVGETAAKIRDWRRPEPYKGKGIRYKGEFIFRKEGKKK